MIIQIVFAFLAGILTVAAPCILPMLPILLGASVGQTSRQRPLLIVCGFITSFAAASLVLSAVVAHVGISQNTIRSVAIIILAVFSFFMVWPLPFEKLVQKFSGGINRTSQIGKGKGNMGGLLLGLVLGVVWTPCAGPVLAAILAVIAIQGTTAHAAILIVAYALGAGIPMLAIAYGSQWLTTKITGIARYATRLQQVFGVLVLLLAVAMFFQYDIKIENKLTAFFPQNNFENNLIGKQTAMENITVQNYGPAPEFTGISHWINLPAGRQVLTLDDLKGKVVLVDFWTYSCINCIRTLPYVTKWYDTYKDKGFVVIGVHTPEFAFEKITGNVEAAAKRFGITYPVAQDNDYGTWNAYHNEYWPAEYLIDNNGNIVYTHFGEGNYDHTENAIRQLLGMDASAQKNDGQDLSNVGSPEMYFEPSRLEYLTPNQQASSQPAHYSLPATPLALNTFALEGTWQFTDDHASLAQPNGKIKLHFSSGKIFMVASSDHPTTIHISVDGKPQPDVTVQMSELYPLFDSGDYGDHTIEISIPDGGFNAFTFTFG